MLFDRFRHSSSDRDPRFAFYGKLPFDREFLRYHLDSPEGRWITSWVDGAHQLIAARRETGDPRTDSELCAILAREGGRSALAALIRPSSDGGGRSYPSCAFCVLPAAELRDAWHLSPLWLEPVWLSMAENILGATPANRKEFDGVLDRAALEPAEPDAVAARFESASKPLIGQPWEALTGASGEGARSLAATFVQLGRVQREAAGGRGSIAVRIPLSNAADPAAALQAAMWLRSFAAVSAFESPWPAVIAVRQTIPPQARSVCIFGRDPTADDLAYLLSGLGAAAIDDLGDAWEVPPEAEEDRRRLEVLVDQTPKSFADLWQRLG